MTSFTCPSPMTVRVSICKDGSDRQGLGLWSMRERVRYGRWPIRDSFGKQKGNKDRRLDTAERSLKTRSEPADEPAARVRSPLRSRRWLNWRASLLPIYEATERN